MKRRVGMDEGVKWFLLDPLSRSIETTEAQLRNYGYYAKILYFNK